MDCARAFAEVAAPSVGLGAPAVCEAIRGEDWLGPDPRALVALNSPTVARVPEGWVGPEETEEFAPSRTERLASRRAYTNPVSNPR
eukprot:4899971-Alexandrium_andersonii.AAC.1